MKGNNVINIDDLDDAAEMDCADSIKLVLIEFELIGQSIERVSDKTQKCQWKHKSSCHTFYQYDQKNKKGWDIGKFNYHLAQISSNDNKKKGNKTTKAHAKRILNLRKSSKLITPPADGCSFLSVEDDLTHHIQECLIFINAVVITSFFRTPYVKALLRGLDDWRRPTYWLKTM